MDYPGRRRLKIYAHIEMKDLGADPALSETLALPGYKAKPERALLVHLEAFDWNCPQHITPRFTDASWSKRSRRCASASNSSMLKIRR